MKIKAPAKINLTLDILGKLPNDYHELTTVYQAVSLYDELEFEESEVGDIKITSNSDQIPLDENNIVYKAVELIRQKHDIGKGLSINIEKNIPVAAGLAGGSTDAAATLKALNEIWELKLSDEILREYAAELGMDVSFLINGGGILTLLAIVYLTICILRILAQRKYKFAKQILYYSDINIFIQLFYMIVGDVFLFFIL